MKFILSLLASTLIFVCQSAFAELKTEKAQPQKLVFSTPIDVLDIRNIKDSQILLVKSNGEIWWNNKGKNVLVTNEMQLGKALWAVVAGYALPIEYTAPCRTCGGTGKEFKPTT